MNAENSLFVVPYEFVVLYVSLILQDTTQARPNAGSRDIQLVKPCFLRIANTVKEVAYRIGHHHF
jgi:hypothetical protein